ncbi:MAG: AAA family ATPase [Eubacteriales bacterium]|jgi:hypothetical protein
MRIQSLYYRDEDCNWTLQPTQFDLLTLFVGISGVGKSRILEAIMSLRDVVLGHTDRLGGVSFTVEFSTGTSSYRWKCRFEALHRPNLKSRHARQLYPTWEMLGVPLRPAIVEEQLVQGSEEIFRRDVDGCYFQGKLLPRPNPYRSMLELFSSEPVLKEVRDSFLSIFLMEFTSDMNVLVDASLAKLYEERNSAEDERQIITSNAPLIAKLAYYSKARPEKFQRIRQKFIDVFPQVEDLCFREVTDSRFYILHLKERGTDYIPQGNFSSGMFKTLLFLTQLSMLEGSCVVLIDEIENSLGLNCIDILTDELAEVECDDQFFITSHHPYIINNIDMEYWRVVNRKGSAVSVKTAKDLHMGDSSHEAFFQLINSAGYRKGIEL